MYTQKNTAGGWGGTERNEDEEQFSKGYHHDLSGFRLGVSYKMKLLIKHYEGHYLGQNPLIPPGGG